MDFPALTGYYRLLFLYIEPASTMLPAILTWFYPGPAWFHSQLVPGAVSRSNLDDRTRMAVIQLASCYMLLSLISNLVFRAVRDALPNNGVAQERIIGAALTALAIADVSHVICTLIVLPYENWWPSGWNATTAGNFPFTVFLFLSRMSWFAGLGRTTYYYAPHRRMKNVVKTL